MYAVCRGDYMDYTAYIRNRITELRMRKNISEYQMSLELGQNKNYIQGISSGKAMPSMAQFLNICEYFEITPMQFFDSDSLYPQLIRKAMEEMKALDEDSIMLLIHLIQRLRGAQDNGSSF